MSKGNELRFFLRIVPDLTHSLMNFVGEGRFSEIYFFYGSAIEDILRCDADESSVYT